MSGRDNMVILVAAVVLCMAVSVFAAPAYKLAFFREIGMNETAGNHSAFAHVWDAAGNPMEGVTIRSVDGSTSRITNSRGRAEIPLFLPGPYQFEVVDPGATSDVTPVMINNRAPNFGHYCWQFGFYYKAEEANAGSFDLDLRGTPNIDSPSATDLDSATTKSMVYHYWDPTWWPGDTKELGSWAYVEQGQTFVVPADTTDAVDRIVAGNCQCTKGAATKVAFGVQIHEGGPTGPAIGPPAYSLGDVSITINSDEFWSFLVTWGLNDNPVAPGQTYYARVFAADQPETPENESIQGMNVWVSSTDTYPDGTYHHEGSPVVGQDLMGFLVGAHTGGGGTSTPAFVWTENWEEVTPAPGANEWSPLNYGPKADKGTWNNLNYGHTVNNDPGAWGDGTRQRSTPNAGTVIALSQDGAVGPGASWGWRQVDGLTAGKRYRLSYWASTSGYDPPPPGAVAALGYTFDLEDDFVGGTPPPSVRYPGDGVSVWAPNVDIATRCGQIGRGTPVWVDYETEFVAEGNSVKLWLYTVQTVLHSDSDPFPWRLFDLYVDDIRLEEVTSEPSQPTFTAITRTGPNAVTLTWTSVSGTTYRVWSVTDLPGGIWPPPPGGETTATGDTTDWSDAIGGLSGRHYQVEVVE